jgi:putative salt-induced outer membrane protein YdiY
MSRQNRSTAVCTVLALLALAAPAGAQPPAPAEPPPRLEASAQIALLATTGNAKSDSLGAAGELISRPDQWIFTTKAAFAQTSDHDELKARSVTALGRADRLLSPRLSTFSQYDFLRDLFAGVEDRQTIQAGLSYLLVNQASHRLRLDGGIGYQHEGRVDAPNSNNMVFQGGPAYRWTISKTSELVEELKLTLPFTDTDQWKVDQSVSLTAAINSIFSVKFTNIVRFVNAPVPGFESTDTITTFALVMKFRRPPPAP